MRYSKNNPKKETLPWQNRDARPTGDELDEDRQNQEGIMISVTILCRLGLIESNLYACYPVYSLFTLY